MSWESDNPAAVVDGESSPPRVVIRYRKPEEAEWYLGYLHDHGGTALREKVERGGYGINVRKGGTP